VLRAHKANGIGIFKQMRDDPPSRTEMLSLQTAVPDGLTLHDGMVSGNGSLTFNIGARHVYAVRLQYGYVKTSNPWPTLRVDWRNATGAAGSLSSTVSGPDQPTWALVDGKIHTDAKIRTDRTLTLW